MAEWFVRFGSGKVVGPVAEDLLVRGIKAGKVPAEADVRQGPTDEWMPLISFEQFQDALGEDAAPTRIVDSPWFAEQGRLSFPGAPPSVRTPAAGAPSAPAAPAAPTPPPPAAGVRPPPPAAGAPAPPPAPPPPAAGVRPLPPVPVPLPPASRRGGPLPPPTAVGHLKSAARAYSEEDDAATRVFSPTDDEPLAEEDATRVVVQRPGPAEPSIPSMPIPLVTPAAGAPAPRPAAGAAPPAPAPAPIAPPPAPVAAPAAFPPAAPAPAPLALPRVASLPPPAVPASKGSTWLLVVVIVGLVVSLAAVVFLLARR